MKRHSLRALLPLLLCGAVFLPPANAYTRMTTTPGGTPLCRTDFQSIQFLVNSATAAGMTNDEGQPIITADSDPIAALRSSLAAWNSIASSAVRFAELQTASLADNPNDNQHVFIFTDSPEHRAMVGAALAIAWTVFDAQTGNILDTDIIFNPTKTFSTNLTPDTSDLESTATHELGHALGAGHTVFFGATMYQSGPRGSNFQARLSSDDIAFATSVYPAAGAEDNYGSIAGTVTFQGGGPVRGVFVTAVDRTTGVHVSGLSSTTAGTYAISGVPPGQYSVYVEPLDGPVLPVDVSLPDGQVDVDFRATALGGFDSPTVVNVLAGSQVNVDIAVEAGASALDIDILGVGATGGTGDASFGRFAQVLTAGQPVDLLLWGAGLDNTISENDMHLLGPGVEMRPGTLRVDQLLIVNGSAALRMTVDVTNPGRRSLVSIVVAKGSEAAAYSGSLVIVADPVFTAAGLDNSASFVAGAMAPDSWADLWGQNLANSFVLDGAFPTELDGTSITITDSLAVAHEARLHFVMPERIQFLTPPGIATGPATLRVTNSTGGSTTATIQMATVGPGLFSANASGQGPAAATFLRIPGYAEAFTFTLDAPPNRVNVPIDLGPETDQIYLSLYGTGFRAQTSVSCTIGGADVPVYGALAQGQFEGLDQAVVGPLPRSLIGHGEANVVLTFDGVQANIVTVSFQ